MLSWVIFTALYDAQIIFTSMSSFGPRDPEKQRQQMPLVSFYSCLWGLSELPGAEQDWRQGCHPKGCWHPDLEDHCWHESQVRFWLTLVSTDYINPWDRCCRNRAEVKWMEVKELLASGSLSLLNSFLHAKKKPDCKFLNGPPTLSAASEWKFWYQIMHGILLSPRKKWLLLLSQL